MGGWLVKNAGTNRDAAAFGVFRAKIEPPDPGKRNSLRTHGTGFQRYIHVAALKPLGLQNIGGLPDRNHFSMTRWVLGPNHVIARGRDNTPLRPDNDGANGHFTARCSIPRFLKCLPHEWEIINHGAQHSRATSIRQGLAAIRLYAGGWTLMVRPMSEDQNNTEDKGERIAKALARAGVGSRRDVERMIGEGRISLNGKTLETPAILVKSLEGIKVDGEIVQQAEGTKLWRMHKTKGTLTTHKDPEGRRTVFDRLPKHIGRVISVGRLDMNTEGLLLLTNDGALARWMELPANALVRKYRVRVYGRVDPKALAKLKDGVTIDGVHYGEVDAKLESRSKKQSEEGAIAQTSANSWLTVAIREGKNREVRRVMEHLGLTVNRLIRTHYGPFSLGNLPAASVAQVNDKQLHDVMPEFFGEAPSSVAAPSKQRDPSKWAKAKKEDRKKPGTSRRRKPRQDDRNQTDSRRKSDDRRRGNQQQARKGQSKPGPRNKRP